MNPRAKGCDAPVEAPDPRRVAPAGETVDYQELRNYGKVYSARVSPQDALKTLAKVPGELGLLATPRFMANMQRKNRYWKRKRLASIETRGISNQDSVEGLQASFGFLSALATTCGKAKALEVYQKMWIS
jgi:hypothetical protein